MEDDLPTEYDVIVVGTGNTYIHYMDPKLVKITVGCGISHTITKTYTVQLKHSIHTHI
jgi:hypothetical protein